VCSAGTKTKAVDVRKERMSLIAGYSSDRLMGEVSGAFELTVTVPLVCVLRVLCRRCAAVFDHSAAFFDFSSYCCSRVMFWYER
jgi:hypothetical protein